jgi:serine/threonine protein kinase
VNEDDLTDKPKEPSTDKTLLSVTRKQKLDPDETAHTMLQSSDAEAAPAPSDDEEILDAGTMETFIDPVAGVRDQQTQETVILNNSDVVGGTVKAPAIQGGSSERRDDEVKYEIVRSLGKGGFAWVYLVRNLHLDRLEAMKILNSELTEEQDVLERFIKEARIAANFNHQNIVTVFEVSKGGLWQRFTAPEKIRKRHREPFAYFSMSFVEGETATNLIRKKDRLDQKESISIAMDAAAALEYAHSKGVIHRDIKPDNILVDRGGNGIVMDFGIAKAKDQTRKTAAGTFMGTARYVSPEQAMGREIDGRSDIYSLGITLYELATGRVPFDSDQWMTVLYQHINEPPPAPEKFFGEINRDLRMVILKMLEKKPEDRFQTAHEVFEALNRTLVSLGGRDRRTAAMDQIATRQDFQSPDATDYTERQPQKTPPVRTKVRQKPAVKTKGGIPKSAWLGALAIVVLAVAAYFLIPSKTATVTPGTDNPDLPVPVPIKAKLLVSAFPTGRLLTIRDDAGETVPFQDGELPQVLELPEGSYNLIISYEGQNKEAQAYVSGEVGLNKVNAEFKVENDLFLLEDLK